MTTYELKQLLSLYATARRLAEMHNDDLEFSNKYIAQATAFEMAIKTLENYDELYLMYSKDVKNGESISSVRAYINGLNDSNLSFTYYPCLDIMSFELESL